MDYVGIDVGAEKYFIAWYYKDNKRIKTEGPFKKSGQVLDFLKGKNAIIAIDAPSDVCCRVRKTRKSEEQLGITGFFKTPASERNAQSWMRAGFALWKSLRDSHKMLLEVHPTLIFKKLMNPQSPPHRWIFQKNPFSKNKPKGKTQRIRILENIFHGQGNIIRKLRIDYIDALMAAYTAQARHLGRAVSFGDSKDGRIWFPR